MRFLLILALAFYAASALHTDVWYVRNRTRPLVVSHRGACGIIPEHTLKAYETAYFENTDFNELDLQVSKDGHLVVSHNPCMKETTNVDEFTQYHSRRRNITFEINNSKFTNDYLINDFTFDEIKALKSRSRYDSRNPTFNFLWGPVELREVIEQHLVLNKERPRSHLVGLYIETKMVSFYAERGIDIAKMLHEELKKYGLDTAKNASATLPIIIESFEKESLKYFAKETDLPCV